MNAELKDFIIEQIGVDSDEVTDTALIEDDLGVYGDDAIDFIISYGKRFNVDVSKFMAADYFSAEGDTVLPLLIRLFTGKPEPKRKGLTVGHLEKGIIAGRLDEEIINPK